MDSLPVHGTAQGRLAVPHAVGVLSSLIVFVVLDTLAVVALFFSRHISIQRILLSDWMVLAALLMFYGYFIGSMLALFIGGVGWHVQDLGSAEIITSGKISIFLEVVYALGMGLLKLSICSLLAQIFTTRAFNFAVHTVMVLSAAWSVMTILIGFCICRPLRYGWDKSIPGSCGNQNAAYSATSGIEIIIDTMICALPLPMVWNLFATTTTKVSLTLLFCLGLFTIIMTGIRLNAMLDMNFDDFSFASINIYIWTTVEWGTATIVTCGPGCKPLLERIFPARLARQLIEREGGVRISVRHAAPTRAHPRYENRPRSRSNPAEATSYFERQSDSQIMLQALGDTKVADPSEVHQLELSVQQGRARTNYTSNEDPSLDI